MVSHDSTNLPEQNIIHFRFPAQDKVEGDSKIPTIIYYDKDGEFCAAGTEAVQDSLREQIEDEGWWGFPL